MSSKKAAYIFRLFSNRGTDHTVCVWLRAGMSKQDVRDVAERWAEILTSGTAIHEYTVQCRRVRLAKRRELLKQFKAVCNRREKIERAYQCARAKLNPMDERGLC